MALNKTTVRPMRTNEAAAVAALHRDQLQQAFLSTLGTRFLAQLYRGIASSDHGFVLVAVDDTDRIVGFISGGTNTKKLYRSILLRRGWIMGFLVLPRALSFSVIKRIWQSLRYPSTTEGAFPDAELLSVAVCADMQGRGPAKALLDALFAEFQTRGVRDIRVTVGAQLARANAYYLKHGFVKAGTIASHGATANVYVTSTEG